MKSYLNSFSWEMDNFFVLGYKTDKSTVQRIYGYLAMVESLFKMHGMDFWYSQSR